MFNFVFADDQGNIAHRASGAVPIRAGADGGYPRLPAKDGSDDWTGFIPKDRMPGMQNPARAWVGTANNDTRAEGYPWYYTNYVSPNYRYRRIGQVLGGAQQMSVDDHWKLMQDRRNLQSDVLRKPIVAALKSDPAQRDLAYTVLSVKRIALGLGFGDAGYFSRFFQRQTGLTPTAWRAAAGR